MASELRLIAERIQALLDAGWRAVRVVTDHGFLLLPGGLPKAHLDADLAVERKGRCARLRSGASTPFPTYPWRWDPQVNIATAPGICCFEAGREYEHGGVSPQELITPILTVTGAPLAAAPSLAIEVGWHGMRAVVSVPGAPHGAAVDVRRKAVLSTTSLLAAPITLDDEGGARVLVRDPEDEGDAVFLVVLDPKGNVIAQETTSVGARL